jgi:bacterioferritin
MPNSEKSKITRKQLIEGLNEDLSREYQAIISYVNYSQVLKGAAYMNIADELTVHAKEELSHALKISNHVDYLGGMPSVTPKPVKTSEKAEEMLRFDLENEKETIRQYRRRVRQADELNVSDRRQLASAPSWQRHLRHYPTVETLRDRGLRFAAAARTLDRETLIATSLRA